MYIVWDEVKNDLLKQKRKVSFEEIEAIILNKKELAVLQNPVRTDQVYYIVRINKYVYVVPAIIDNGQIVLKTIFPSRKFNRIYGGKTDE